METKKIYEILVDDLNGLEDEDKICTTFMLFVIGAAAPIIKKTAQSIIESGEIPTINKCIDKLNTDSLLVGEISVILHHMLCSVRLVDADILNPGIMKALVNINFDVIDKDLQKIFREDPDEGEELD